MGFIAWRKQPGTRRSVSFKPGQKVDFKPTVIYNPKKSKAVVGSPVRRGGFSFKIFFAALGAVLLIAGIIFLILGFLQDPRYKVQEFRLLGNRNIKDVQVMALLDRFREQHILTLNTDEVENALTREFTIINGVSVRKFYPNILDIRISEREPKMVYITFSGAYLIDSNGLVIQIISSDPHAIPEEKINIARGMGDPESAFLKEQFVNNYKVTNGLFEKPLEEQQILMLQFDYSAVPSADKLALLRQLETQYKEELYAIWAKMEGMIDLSEYASYPRVNAMVSDQLTKDSKVDMERVTLTSELQSFFAARKIVIIKTIWEGELLVRLVDFENKAFVFGLDRKVTEQFEDFLLVLNQLNREGKDYCQVDLSATKISVRPCR